MIESHNNSKQNITSPDKNSDDAQIEKSLRPSAFNDFIGQKEVMDNLRIYIEAAKQRKESLDHVLLFGPPGLGKTTLANIISKELSVNIKASAGPIIDRPGDLAGILTNLSEFDVFFIVKLSFSNF